MFGNSNKENIRTNVPALMNAHNSLVQGTVVEGNVTARNDIRVDGTIRGILKCDAKVIIGPSGYIEGKIICENAMIEGRFEGDIKVNELLSVRKTAEIHGEVHTSKLMVEAGAVFNVSTKTAL